MYAHSNRTTLLENLAGMLLGLLRDVRVWT
jgi:hypothetical protein